MAFTPQSLAAALAMLLLIGLWTPVAGLLVAAVEIVIALRYPNQSPSALLIAAFSLALAMIGPGALSVDARLFGRKQLLR